ncbi:MAG TPA: winged helix DNA-binding domain-containing protein [Methanoregulaceae archaeon]|nr:winged helix DNA-binding domain-containing protein [Methanoregulaceae archaeon]HPW09660.1 winged helix DNA-binding domain-containing protein [Methanoregulaceae archaeon]
MTPEEIRRLRLSHSGLSHSPFTTGAEAVAHSGAVQAQDFSAAIWSLGLRIRDATAATIEDAYNDGKILRVHVLRHTWHFILPEDLRWMTALTAPGVKSMVAASNRKLGLDPTLFSKSNAAIEKALEDHHVLTRQDLKGILADIGIVTDVQRLAHIIMQAELEGLICSGPMQGRQHTYALADERIRESRALTREQSLAELAHRYFTSHGPAQLKDFSWWSGLSRRDAGVGLDSIREELERASINGNTHWYPPDPGEVIPDPPVALLLSIYDEYAIAYADRSAISDAREIERMITKGNAMTAVIVLHGKVAGTWRRTMKKDSIEVRLNPFKELTDEEQEAVEREVERYGKFFGRGVEIMSGN